MSEPTFLGLVKLDRLAITKSIVAALLAGALVGVISFLLPRTYRAEARILPSSGGLSSALQSLAGGADFSNILEVASPRRENPVQTFPEILLGRVVLGRTLALQYPPADSIQAHTVFTALRIGGRTVRERADRGIRRLRDIMTVSANPRTGMIAVAVETRDSVLSAYVANSLIAELDRFNLETRRSQGRAIREFVARRTDEAKTELKEAENALTAFRQSNLRIGNSPQLNLEEGRLKRELDIRADTYRLLARQYEMARIEEYRDTPTFTIVEPAIPPFRKYRPRVLVNAAAAASIALILSLLWNLAVKGSDSGGGPSQSRPRVQPA